MLSVAPLFSHFQLCCNSIFQLDSSSISQNVIIYWGSKSTFKRVIISAWGVTCHVIASLLNQLFIGLRKVWVCGRKQLLRKIINHQLPLTKRRTIKTTLHKAFIKYCSFQNGARLSALKNGGRSDSMGSPEYVLKLNAELYLWFVLFTRKGDFPKYHRAYFWRVYFMASRWISCLTITSFRRFKIVDSFYILREKNFLLPFIYRQILSDIIKNIFNKNKNNLTETFCV